MRTMESTVDPVATGKVTHRFALSDIMKAYDTFGNAASERALKVILTNPAP